MIVADMLVKIANKEYIPRFTIKCKQCYGYEYYLKNGILMAHKINDGYNTEYDDYTRWVITKDILDKEIDIIEST